MSDLIANAPPSGTGCVECLEAGGWWLHLRRCAACGHIGCCDTLPQSARPRRMQRARTTASSVASSRERTGWTTRGATKGRHLPHPSITPRASPFPGLLDGCQRIGNDTSTDGEDLVY